MKLYVEHLIPPASLTSIDQIKALGLSLIPTPAPADLTIKVLAPTYLSICYSLDALTANQAAETILNALHPQETP